MRSESLQRVVESYKGLAERLHSDYSRNLQCLQAQCQIALQQVMRVELSAHLAYWPMGALPAFIEANHQNDPETQPPYVTLSPQAAVQPPVKNEGESSSRFRDEPKRKLKRQSRKIRRQISSQKKQRNALTNLGSQLLTFIYLKKKNVMVLREKFPDLTSEQTFNYYEWARRIKNSMKGYINMDKLKCIWHKKPENRTEKLFFAIMRTLSFYYLNMLMVPAILTSKKIAEHGKGLHLATRRKILRAIVQDD